MSDFLDRLDCSTRPDPRTRSGLNRWISCRVLQLAEERNMSVTDTAELLGISRSRLTDRFSRGIDWSLADVYLIAEKFEVPLERVIPRKRS